MQIILQILVEKDIFLDFVADFCAKRRQKTQKTAEIHKKAQIRFLCFLGGKVFAEGAEAIVPRSYCIRIA